MEHQHWTKRQMHPRTAGLCLQGTNDQPLISAGFSLCCFERVRANSPEARMNTSSGTKDHFEFSTHPPGEDSYPIHPYSHLERLAKPYSRSNLLAPQPRWPMLRYRSM